MPSLPPKCAVSDAPRINMDPRLTSKGSRPLAVMQEALLALAAHL